MSDVIYPRSSREVMDGWHHLPRYIDKIRLHLGGLLDREYQSNLGKGFDGLWLEAAGLTHEQLVAVVKQSVTDGQVCDWVRENVKRTPAQKKAHWEIMLNRPAPGDLAALERFEKRKQLYGHEHRNDVKNFVDLADADEKRI
ncbi:MAG: DUF5069 domain-containing protein [Akkermansiaceae bacterium]|nr:DUF5069 domain-containing protein [Verrucomicrobiales bacterium]